ncbi:hypothetical protein AURDEDRAFT_162131 [Auricularia subglabra TFB-10046 SS5]|nr:hypothetical protein AURDEDRAFT_162131 [Auricularia subglabra TFB-10046 SS5]
MDPAEASLRARLSVDQQLLASMEQELESTVRERDADILALYTLQNKLAFASADIDDLTARGNSLRASIARRRAMLAPLSLSRLPLEILGMIFCCARDAHIIPSTNESDVTLSRTLQPFKCAAVCRHWRRAALETPSLWTYIGVPHPMVSTSASAWRFRVQQLLARSRACSLHIVIEAGPEGFNRYYLRILCDLLPHCSRWKFLSLRAYGPSPEDDFDVLRTLRGPTPSLETLRVTFPVDPDRPKWPEAPLRYLPLAPKLRAVHLEFTCLALCLRDSSRLPATNLALYESSYDLQRVSTTVLSFSALETLKLYWLPVDTPILPQPQAGILLPELQCLDVARDPDDDDDHDSFSQLLDILVTPKLRDLRVPPDMLRLAAGLIRRCSSTIEILQLRLGYLEDARAVAYLTPLSELRELTFKTCGLVEAFLDALPDVAATIWPKLQRLTLTASDEVDVDSFVRFFEARYPMDRTESTPTCALLEFNLMQENDTALRSRIAADERILASMEADLSGMLQQQDAHQVQLAALQETIVRFDGDILDLSARRDALKHSIGRRRADLAPRSLPVFPFEILGEVFMLAVCSHTTFCFDDPLEIITPECSTQPFKCAAVCKQWRSAALATSALWTYIGVPGTLPRSGFASLWLERVQQLLLRSRACPLHIHVTGNVGKIDALMDYAPILGELLAHCDRWQRFSLAGWGTFAKKSSHPTLALLNGRTPILETISMCFMECDNIKWPSSPQVYLPYAPKLRSARFEYVPVAFDRTSSDPLPATELNLCDSPYSVSRLCATLASFPSLTTLTLCPRDTDGAAGSQLDILLPKLQSLHICRGIDDPWGDVHPSFSSVLDRFMAPNLRALEVFPEAIASTTTLVQRCSATIERLDLSAGILYASSMAESLVPLHELRTITFDSCNIEAEFLNGLCRAPAEPVWPKLERIVLRENQKLKEPAFLRFLRERYPLSSGRAWTCALLEVDMARDVLRDSIAAGEIKHILETERQRLATESQTTDVQSQNASVRRQGAHKAFTTR